VICDDCAARQHERCRRGNWCDCQHRPREPRPPVTGPAGE